MRKLLLAITVLAATSASAQYVLDRCEPSINGGAEMALTRPDERGEPLEVTGTVVDQNGQPLSGILVRAFQADALGVYTDGNDHRPRICGVVRSDAAGRYRFRTIRPASYPDSKIPAHIHFEIWGEGLPLQRSELRFEGDPFLNGRKSEGRVDLVRPLLRDKAGVLRCQRDLIVRR